MHLLKDKVYVNFLSLKSYINECYLNKRKGRLVRAVRWVGQGSIEAGGRGIGWGLAEGKQRIFEM